MLEWCQWLSDTWVGAGIRESIWVYPLLHFTHILANSLLFGTILWMDLRLLGVALAPRRVTDVAEQLLPWTWAGWALMFVSGALIFASDAVRYYESTLFRAKLLLMGVAGVNALVFHRTVYPGVAAWEHGRVPGRARLAGAVSLACWLGVLITGRAVGYF